MLTGGEERPALVCVCASTFRFFSSWCISTPGTQLCGPPPLLPAREGWLLPRALWAPYVSHSNYLLSVEQV